MTKCPSNPLGIKGCGEAGAIAAPAAVINAITDAIGTEAVAMPATPPTVWAALQKSGRPRRTRREQSSPKRQRPEEITENCDVQLHLPSSGDAAAGGQLLSKNPDAKLLAGGHTLLPTMKLRLAGPPELIDLSRVQGLAGIELAGRSITIGAMTRHVDVTPRRSCRSMRRSSRSSPA